MSSWQKRARLGVAAFGVACAVAVYLALGTRQPPSEPMAVPRLDPTVVLEGVGVGLERVSGARQAFFVSAARTLTYEDGSRSYVDVRIEATNRNGRAFVVTAREGRATRDDAEIELTRDVLLRESDGFELRTGQAVFHRESGEVRAAGAVTFLKGRMTGSGLGTTYVQATDVLRIADRARVDVAEGAGLSSMSFSAGTATLDRVQHVLTLEREVRMVQGAEVTEADQVTARLSETDDVVRFVELRGRARVTGGTAVEAMRARDIDLDYTGEGDRIERAVLMGDAVIVLTGTEAAAGRELGGGRLDAHIGEGGEIASIIGEGGVHMRIPATADAPGRRIDARILETTATNGQITRAHFTGDARFQEDASAGGAPRGARASTLTLSLDAEAIRRAEFTGAASFEEGDLQAGAATATYAPVDGVLQLRGSDARGRPRVSDDDVSIEADGIDVTLAGRRIEAAHRVETTLRARPGKAGRGLPGLLRPEEQATVISRTLVYGGTDATGRFAGGARLWQGDTEIRAETIELQQDAGVLIARGGARALIQLEDGRSEGSGDEIRYTDAERLITYSVRPEAPAAEGVAPTARVTGQEGDLRGRRIDVRLERDERRLAGLEANGGVTAVVGARTVTGETLSYGAADGSYHVLAGRGRPVTVEESCRVATGRALTFSRSTDTMTIDGRTDFRTESKRKSGCADPPPR
jgi:lipopolysaccharide export system protein LptA